MNKAEVEVWREAISDSMLLYNIKQLSTPYDSAHGFEGNVRIEEKEVLLKVVLPPSFPLELPIILLDGYKKLGQALPHIASFEQVCFQEAEGIIMDSSRPLHIIDWAINRAIEVIRVGLKKENLQDFVEEFEVYWEYLNGETIMNLFNPKTQSGNLVLLHNTKRKVKIIAETQNEIFDFWGLKQVWDKTVIYSATYVVLPATTVITPPILGTFWSLEELQANVKPAKDAMPGKQKRSLFNNKRSKNGFILFALPRSSGGYSLFGVQYMSEEGIHPLATDHKGAHIRLKPFTVKHCEKSYLVPRGGGNKNLSSKKVLLVGCGSVGGHIAHELIRSGVLNLTLIDHDKLALENTFRHVLGKSQVGKNKAKAVEEELFLKYPFVKVNSIDMHVEEAVNKSKISLQDFDLIVVAIGSPTVEMWINEQLYLIKHELPAIFTWLEPLGIGGHALVVTPKSKGCFKCLYTSENEDFYLVNRASFAASGQRFSMSLTGCNNLFTPYGSLDASRTAGIAVKAAINVLNGKTTKSELISWKGEAEEFLHQGFQLSNRYSLSEEQLKAQRCSFAPQDCSICGRTDEVNDELDTL